jgi:hypothetical protein
MFIDITRANMIPLCHLRLDSDAVLPPLNVNNHAVEICICIPSQRSLKVAGSRPDEVNDFYQVT